MSEQTAEVADSAVVDVAEQYYDSDDADRFYFEIWGGEDIHIGLYDSMESPVREASHKTVERMADELLDITSESTVLDIGAGYGGAARYLAGRFGCQVTCLNISETQNERNRKLNAKAGLGDSISVVHGNFEDLPFEASQFDIVWSQDAILHSGNRPKVLREVARVLAPGGQFVFTDPMQADDCPEGVLGPVLDRIHLDSLGSVAFYRKELASIGFSEVSVTPLTTHLGRHYARVQQELARRRADLEGKVSAAYIDRMLKGLDAWIDAERRGYLAWGILLFQKSADGAG